MLAMIQVTRGHLRPHLTSFYKKFFPPPLQPMLSTTTFLLSKFSPPPSAAHAFNYNIPFIKDIAFIKIFPSLCSPCFQLQHSFYQNFPPPLCSPCFELQHSFYQKHSFYQNFPPPSTAHACNDSGYQGSSATPPDFLLSKFSPPLCSPCFQLQHSFYQNFPPPSAAHAFNYNIPFIKDIAFIKIFPSLCSPCFQLQHSFYQKTFLLSNFSPPSAAHAFNYIPFIKNIPFVKISPPSAAHAFNDSGYQGSSATLPNFFIHVQRRTEVGSHNTPYSHT